MPAAQSSSSHYPGTLSSRDIRIHNVQLQCDQLWIHSIGTCLVQSGTFRFWEFCSPWKLGLVSIPSQGLELLYFPNISMELSVHRVRAQDSTGTAVEMHAHITNSSKARPSGPQLLSSPLSISKAQAYSPWMSVINQLQDKEDGTALSGMWTALFEKETPNAPCGWLL